MAKPNRYVLGTTPELDVTPKDQDGIFFVPSLARLSIKSPTGDITTVSGGELTLASGYYFYIYRPDTTGWYEYEGWVRDSDGREKAETKGFEIYDRVY